MLFLGWVDLCAQLGCAHSQYWVYPLQTLGCGAAIAYWWKAYPFSRPGPFAFTFAAVAGVAAFALWIAPQEWLGRPPRLEGFDPAFFPPESWLYPATVGFRFLRLVIVVPLLEEVFWRGFLLRYLIREDFTAVPFGAFTWRSFGIVTVAFALEHSVADYPAALVTGALYNLVAVKTRSLWACVAAHAVTNLLLGLYVMQTRQWGFW